MADDTLFERFARLRRAEADAAGRLRRADYKGDRRRLNLRLPAVVLDELQVLKVAEGVDKNQFCADVLTRAVRDRFDRLKAAHDAASWAVITEIARKGRP